MASRTEIANLALGHFGQSRITDIDQNSPAAEAIRDCWNIARDAALRSHHWNFASARVELSALAEAPVFGWSYQYQLPADFRKLVSVNCVLAGTRDCPFVVEGRRLLSNAAEAKIVYIRNVVETELWDPEFVTAFSFKLAELVAPRLSNDGGYAAKLAARKEQAGLGAMLSDATDTRPHVRKATDGSQYHEARECGFYPAPSLSMGGDYCGPCGPAELASHTHSLSDITVSGAAIGQVPVWNGTAWAPAAMSGAVATDSIWDAAGDLAVGSGSNTAARLAIGTAGQVLKVNAGGTGLEWATVSGSGTVTSVQASGGSTGLTFSGGPITGSGTLTLGGTLALAYGGTGATTAAGARTALGLGTAAVAATGDFAAAVHSHAASDVTSGVFNHARLGTGGGGATKFLREDGTWQTIGGGGDALTANPLSQFAATTSAQLAGVISDETGTGALVFAASPALSGTPTAPTAAGGTNTTQIATTAFVASAISAAGAGYAQAGTIDDSLLTLDGPGLAGRETSGAGGLTTISIGGGLEFSAATLRRSALTGDVTASAGSNSLTIANDAVTYAKMQNVSATDKLLGRATAGAGDVEEITCTAAGRALLDDADAAAQRTTLGVGTGDSPQFTGINVGHASDTTITRSAAGKIAVEGVDAALVSGAQTLTDKTLGSGCVVPVVLTIACSDETTAATAGTGKVTFRMPFAMTLTAVRLSMNTAPTGSTFIADLNENGTSVLSTKLSVDASEKTSTTAASAAVISDSALADDSEMTVDFDQVGSTIAGAGIKITLIGTRTLP